MKYIFMFLIFSVLISAQSFERARVINRSINWADSLFMTHEDSAIYTFPDGSTAAKDTVKIYEIRRQFCQFTLTVQDTGASFTDSLLWYRGTIVRDEGQGEVDTLWHLILRKDSALISTIGTSVMAVIANANAVKYYTSDDPNLINSDLMKIVLSNYNWVAGRLTKLFWEGLKDE